ncbi:SDR family NAD(P)-dependent oxidoreductase [Burkholderia sp. D-99]|uniref:SDR family NAD(P)-dependent oxidoreductase n=1 Tax=Burkholderia sp. D-99 TaxID=2717316 RepID=UPI0014224C22|nr:SDR family oxidoreductase [Burkholderia sp. D-99]NHV25888.1 SDR family oxidoreductase [Burkholderia sp. D-99]
MGRLAGKTAVITGAGQNIGRAIAELFAEEGANVVVNGLSNASNVDEVVAGIRAHGGHAIGVMADVSDPEQVESLLDAGERAFGAIDIAVNNVGRRLRMKFDDITVEAWSATLASNLSSAFYMAHYVVPRMRRRRWGRIINISGYDGFTGHFPQRAANVAAKAGMHGLTKAIAREAGVDNITCNTVVPGAIQTTRDLEQYKHVNIERVMEMLAIKHPGEPRDIAEACLYLASASGDFVTGQAIHVNGGEYMF